jgi:penicillin-binding protein 1A
VLREDEADLVTHALRNAVDEGTATSAQIEGWQTAGKTGTTSNNKDAWFVGYVPEFTTSVWMGNPVRLEDMTPANGYPRRVVGGSYPAEMWRTFMVEAAPPEEDHS